MPVENTAAPAPQTFDRLIETIAAVECVLSVLEQESVDAGRDSHLSSAALVLRQSIKTLYDISGDVEIQQREMREVAHGTQQ